MSVEQYCALVELLPQIEKTLKERGEKVPRPRYGGRATEDANGDANDDEQMDAEAEDKKPNIEATSDEEDEE